MSIRAAITSVRSKVQAALEAIKARLIADWKRSLSFGSVRLHLVSTVSIVGYIADNPNALNNLLGMVQPAWRVPTLLALASAWSIFGWAVRVYQGKSNG